MFATAIEDFAVEHRLGDGKDAMRRDAFKPDWAKHSKAAPFKRNDAMLDVLRIGVLVFPGNGINDNLADKARKLGIPLFDFRKGGA